MSEVKCRDPIGCSHDSYCSCEPLSPQNGQTSKIMDVGLTSDAVLKAIYGGRHGGITIKIVDSITHIEIKPPQ